MWLPSLVRRRMVSGAVGASAEHAFLRVANVSLSFGGVQALGGVSFDVMAPQIVGLVGANGAGKSTLLNCIAGRFRPQGGCIEFRGRDIMSVPKHRIHELGITRTFQNLSLFGSMSVFDNLAMGLYAKEKGGLVAGAFWSRSHSDVTRNDREVCDAVGIQLGLQDVLYRPVSGLPYGLQKRVELGRAIVSKPSLVLIDEPATGLSRAEVEDLQQVLFAVALEGVAMVIVDHNFSFMTSMADEIVFMDSGVVVVMGPPDEIRNNATLRKQYLGEYVDHD